MSRTLPERIQNAIENAHDFESFVHGLLAQTLGWPIAQHVEDIGEIGFAWTPDELGAEGLDEKIVDGRVWQIQPLPAERQPWGIFLLEFANEDVFTKGRGMVAPLRQVLRGLVPRRRREPNLPAWRHEDLLFICTHAWRHFAFAHFKGEKAPTASLSTFGWSRGQSGFRTLCEFNLPRLRWPDAPADHQAWREQWSGAFDKEELTKRFFKRFRRLCGIVAHDIARRNDLDQAKANSEAQILLERLLFLYFIQRKGWLDRKPDYLVREFNEHHRHKPDDTSYYHSFLSVVFRRLSSRQMGREAEIGHLPFLNGGLFEEDPGAFKDATPLRLGLKVGNGVMAQVFDELLERYNFTIREDTPLDHDVAVDPEMLGKILECLVLEMEAAEGAPDRRKATGSYYTPRIVVHFICREVLRQFLLARLDGPDWDERLKRLLAIDASHGLRAHDLEALERILTPDEAARVRSLLRDIKACDPAVGSGAFAVGLLHELVNLCVICETRERGKDPRLGQDPNYLFRLKLHFIENAIYGVDILERAVEICKLRLWLSLIVDYQLRVDPFACTKAQFVAALKRIPPLPNLDFKIRRGDSLLDQLHGHPVILEVFARDDRARNLIATMEESKHRFFKTDSVIAKRALLRRLLENKLDLAELLIRQQLENLRKVQLYLFGETTEDPRKRRWREEQKRKLNEAQTDIWRIREELKKIKPGKGSLSLEDEDKLRRLDGRTGHRISFVWRLDFMEVFNRPQPASTFDGDLPFPTEPGGQRKLIATTTRPSGFDIIVGNPPFVTCRDKKRREQYRKRWPLVCYQKYSLVAPFFQCSFGLLAPGGHLGFIVSNAFAKRSFGKPLVEKFFPTVTLTKIVDCSGLMFPGHGTPTCLVFGRNRSPKPHSTIRVAAILPGGGDLRTPPENSRLWRAIERYHDSPGYTGQRVVVADCPGEALAKWPCNFDVTTEPTRTAIERHATPLHCVIESYGSMFDTHKDDVFVLSADVLRRLSVESTAVVQVAFGDHLRDWSLLTHPFCLRPYDPNWDLLREEPSNGLFSYLKRFRDELGSRATFSGRSYDEAGEPWYRYHQMSVSTITAPMTIVYPEIATHGHFVPRTAGILFTQTAPLVCPKHPSHAKLLAALMNSSAALFWLKQVCFNKNVGAEEERDRYEYAGGKVEQLPVPGVIASALSCRGKTGELGQAGGK